MPEVYFIELTEVDSINGYTRLAILARDYYKYTLLGQTRSTLAVFDNR